MKCWLCQKEGLAPGEGEPNVFGDVECQHCTDVIESTVYILAHPEIIPVIQFVAAQVINAAGQPAPDAID